MGLCEQALRAYQNAKETFSNQSENLQPGNPGKTKHKETQLKRLSLFQVQQEEPKPAEKKPEEAPKPEEKEPATRQLLWV